MTDTAWAIQQPGFLGTTRQLVDCAKCGSPIRKGHHETRHYGHIGQPTVHCICDDCYDQFEEPTPMTDTHTDATALEALAKRVEAGETGREIDRDVGLALGEWEYLPSDHEVCQQWPNRKWLQCDSEIFADHDGAMYSAAYSESLDAVAALAERVLPTHQHDAGYSWGSSEGTGEGFYSSIDLPFGGGHVYVVMAPTECAARLAAILRAKAKDSDND